MRSPAFPRTPVEIVKWVLLVLATGVLALRVWGFLAPDSVLTRAATLVFFIFLGRKLWLSLRERRIEFDGDMIDWSTWIFHRDTTPILYWTVVGLETVVVIACLIGALFGW